MSETLIASEKVYNKSQQKVRDIIFKYDSVANLEQLRNLYRTKEGKQQCNKEAANAHRVHCKALEKVRTFEAKFNLDSVSFNETVLQDTQNNMISHDTSEVRNNPIDEDSDTAMITQESFNVSNNGFDEDSDGGNSKRGDINVMGEGGDAEYSDVEESPGLVARYGNEEEDDDYEDNEDNEEEKEEESSGISALFVLQ